MTGVWHHFLWDLSSQDFPLCVMSWGTQMDCIVMLTTLTNFDTMAAASSYTTLPIIIDGGTFSCHLSSLLLYLLMHLICLISPWSHIL